MGIECTTKCLNCGLDAPVDHLLQLENSSNLFRVPWMFTKGYAKQPLLQVYENVKKFATLNFDLSHIAQEAQTLMLWVGWK